MDAGFLASLQDLYDRSDAAVREFTGGYARDASVADPAGYAPHQACPLPRRRSALAVHQ